MEMIYMMLYVEEAQGLEGPEKVSTRWPARCHVTHHVHVAELKETAQLLPPYQHNIRWLFLILLPRFGI